MWQVLLILWASPGSLVGLTAGMLGLLTGGAVRRVGRTLEFHGGFIRWLLERWPVRAAAMTLGHVIIGRDVDCLLSTRDMNWCTCISTNAGGRCLSLHTC